MYAFKAHRVENQVIINGQYQYKQGEVLTELLNQNYTKLKEKFIECSRLRPKIRYPEMGVPEDYTSHIYTMQFFFAFVDRGVLELPLYNKTLKPEDIGADALVNLLSEYPFLFNTGETNAEQKAKRRRRIRTEAGNLVLTKFVPDVNDDTLLPEINKLNDRITALCEKYFALATELLRIPFVYGDLLDNYIHKADALQPPDIAQAMEQYQVEKAAHRVSRKIWEYERLARKVGTATSHEVMRFVDERGKESKRLWEVTEYSSIGGFVYDEFFDGLQTGRLPKRCGHCGRYFLLESGYAADFCENPAPGEKAKTCRDIGARKRYDEKVKSDPVWLAYQRAYKTHYARVSKKKMTKPEFAAWSDYAIELRTKAQAGEMDFDTYLRELKK